MVSSLLVYAGVAFVTCVTPGAGVLYTVSNAFRYGRGNAWRSPLGNAVGVAAMSAVSATGLGALVATSPVLLAALEAVGASVLIWFGWRSWHAPVLDVMRVGGVAAGSQDSSAAFAAGVRHILPSAALLQVTNPMLIVFLLSFMPPFIDRDAAYAPQAAMLSALFVLICLAVHLVYSYAACTVGGRLKGAALSFWLNRISAVLFWLCAAGVIASIVRDVGVL